MATNYRSVSDDRQRCAVRAHRTGSVISYTPPRSTVSDTVLWGVVLWMSHPDGARGRARLGEAAEEYQRDNAGVILDLGGSVRQSWIESLRGARETTALAARCRRGPP
jgi:hypothetical protein